MIWLTGWGCQSRNGDLHTPPSLEQQIAAVGIQPGQIGYVIITHTHFDHYNGLTGDVDGELAAIYPQARHYLGWADWQRLEEQ